MNVYTPLSFLNTPLPNCVLPCQVCSLVIFTHPLNFLQYGNPPNALVVVPIYPIYCVITLLA